MYLQLQFEYEYFEISCIFPSISTPNVKNFAAGPMLPGLKHESKMLHFLLQFLKVIAELTVEFVFHGTLLSYCCLMSANVSGLVNLCITCNDIEVEIAYYIAVSHDHYLPTNVKVYKSFGTQY